MIYMNCKIMSYRLARFDAAVPGGSLSPSTNNPKDQHTIMYIAYFTAENHFNINNFLTISEKHLNDAIATLGEMKILVLCDAG